MFTTAALIGAGSSILGNMIGASSTNKTNKNNLKINQMNNEFNERMMQKQMDYNTMMWDKQNEYNTPSAQRARLEAAGMNPYMMLNGGSAGNAQAAGSTSAASAASAPPQQAFHPDFSGIPQSILMAKQGANIDADTQQKVIDNQSRAFKNMQEIGNLIAESQNKQVINKLMKTQLKYADQAEQLALQSQRVTAAESRERTLLLEEQRIYQSLVSSKYNEIVDKDLAHKVAQTELYAMQNNLTAEQYRKEMFNVVVAEFEAKLGEVNYKVAKDTADDIIRRTSWQADYGPFKDILGDIFNTADAAMKFGGRKPKPKMELTRRKVGGNHKGDYYEDIFELR